MSDLMAILVIGVPATILLSGWLWMYNWKQKKVREYIARYKKTVIDGIIRFVDPRLSYDHEAGVSPEVYKASGLFPRAYDRYFADDFVEGRLGLTPVAFSEIHTEYKTQRSTSTNRTKDVWHTIFQGLFFVCEFNKMFQGRTVVLPDKLEGALGDFGAALQREKTRFGELVKLEDPEFERLFAVYGSDQVMARYVLSTSLMARLTAFRMKSKQDIRLAFVDSNLFVAISYNRELFEPRIWRTLLDYKEPRFFFEVLQFVAGIVDDLNLNTRIWGARALEHLQARGGAGAGKMNRHD